MISIFSYRAIAAIAALLLAMTSIGSAARMAPAQVAPAQIAAFLSIGGTLKDLCADTSDHHHDAQCPFCNTVALVKPIAPAGQVWTIRPDLVLAVRGPLTHGDQRHHSRWSARGPPIAA